MRLFHFILLVFLLCSCLGEDKKVQTTKVLKGDFEVSMMEVGELKSTNSSHIYSPNAGWKFGMLKITDLIEDGSEINVGDTVLRFDLSEVEKALYEAERELEVSKAQFEKLLATQTSKIEQLEADIQIAELQQRIAEIDYELSAYDSEIRKKEIALNLEKSKISLKKAKDQIENQKLIHREEQEQLKVTIDHNRLNVEQAKKTQALFTITSKEKGIAIIRRNHRTKSKWQVSDQPWGGTPIIDIPDLSELKALANINEVDITKIKKGLPVKIKLDAFSDTVYEGRVTQISNLAMEKEGNKKIKIFPIEILLLDKAPSLLPGMTVSCDILINQLENQVYIPREALFEDQGDYVVYVSVLNGFKSKKVEIGPTNSDYVVITKGLKEGDEISLQNPEAIGNDQGA